MVDTVNYAHQHADGFSSVGAVVEDKLYESFDVRRKVVVKSGAGILKRGTVVGKITAGGKWVKSAADDGAGTPVAITDGSQVVRGVLLHDVDATSADAEAIIGRRGRCNSGALILGSGHTLASIEDACIDRGLIFESIIG